MLREKFTDDRDCLHIKRALAKVLSALTLESSSESPLKVCGFFHSRLRSIASDLGRSRMIKNRKAKELLVWSANPAKEEIQSRADSLLWYDIVG